MKEYTNFLETILKEKKDFVEQGKKVLSQDKLIYKINLLPTKSRFKNILGKPGMHLIAEIKRASPSRGDLRLDLNIIDIANIYEQEGIELMSVLTDEKFFRGNIDDLTKVKQNTKLSILRKDFIIDSYQIYEAKAYGADAILLIARILPKGQLEEFLKISKSLNMDVVVEVHSENDLEKILGLGQEVEIIGINHRDLEDFSIDLKMTEKLLPKIPKGKIVISESGIETVLDIREFKRLGVNAVLIGESLMREKDIKRKLNEFINATR